MKILIVNYYYHPVINAHTYRWHEIANLWAQQGHNVEILTSAVQGMPKLEVNGKIKIHRIGIRKESSHEPLKSQQNSSSVLKTILSKLKKFTKEIYRTLYWPDAYWHWIPAALLHSYKLRNSKYDLIISYYPCMGAHLIGYAIKTIMKSKCDVKWIADYGDPFSMSTTMPPNNFRIYSKLNHYIENKIIKTATLTTLTNVSTYDGYAKKYHQYSSKIACFPHLVNIEKFHSVPNADDLVTDKLETVVLTYIGSFHKGIREPFQLFELIKKINENSTTKYDLNIFGPDNGFNLMNTFINEITYHGQVSREDAIKVMQKTDFLINIENSNCVMTPSKIVEYIATGKPIINIGTSEELMSPLLEYQEMGYAFSYNGNMLTNEIIIALKDFILNKAHTQLPLSKIHEILAKYEVHTIAKKYISSIN